MWQDPIVEELRKLREAHAESHHFDSDSIFAELKQKEDLVRNQGRKFVTLPKKPVQDIKVAA